MDITVYLPDELGARAKEANLNFSRLLRDRVEIELRVRHAMRAAAGEAVDWEIELESGSGHTYKGRVRGTLLVEGSRGVYIGSQIIVTEDGRFIFYDANNLQHYELDEGDTEVFARSIRELCYDDEEYVEVMAKIGREAVIDL